MRIIPRYIMQSFLSAFFLAWLVLTFVLTVGLLFRVIQLLADGLPFATVGRYLLAGLPEMLGFTVPLALLVSAMLVFGRLSSDSEISAMKACGVSFWSIMRWPLIVGVVCSVFAFFLQSEVMPRAHYLRRTILNEAKLEVGLEILEPGRFIDEIENLTFFCARKEDNWLYNVYIIDRRNPLLTREIYAEKALVQQMGDDIRLDMYTVRVDPVQDDQPGAAMADHFSYIVPGTFRNKKYTPRLKDFSFSKLRKEMKRLRAAKGKIDEKERRKALTKTRFIFNNRIVWSLASFCFVLVGVPMGVKGQRKESSAGMGMCLAIGISFFAFLLLAETLSDKPMAFPYVLVWIPVLICIGVAGWLIPRNQ